MRMAADGMMYGDWQQSSRCAVAVAVKTPTVSSRVQRVVGETRNCHPGRP